MQPHHEQGNGGSANQPTIAERCTVGSAGPVGAHSKAPVRNPLSSNSQADQESHLQGLGSLLSLCQSPDAGPAESTLRVLTDSSFCSWTKHFSLQELTSESAECSIFCPDSGPFPGDGPAVNYASEHVGVLPAHFSPFGGILPPRSSADSGALDGKSPAIKRERQESHADLWTQPIATDDAFMRRLLKMRNSGPSPHSPSNDDSLDSGGLVASSKPPRIPPSSLRSPDASFSFSTGFQESCCKTADGAAPQADIHVPSVCECGTAIVGVWYRNRPYYTHWFRHPRYAALRCMLEQNRCKNKYRPMCGIHASVGLASPVTNKDNAAISESAASRQDSAASAPSGLEAAAVGANSAPSVISEDNFGSVMSAEELLAPKFMSLLCMFQLVKHLDAVGIIYPSTALSVAPPPNMKIEHVKISAHIDCERSKGFVQYRWYSTDVNDLVDDLTSGDKNTKKVVGCCCLGHWKRKPPGRDSSKSTSQLIVSAALEVKDVYSPFELDCKRPAALGLFDTPSISIIDWESLDHSVWATCKSLLLLPPEVIEASMKIPFSREKHVSREGSIYCSAHCDTKSPADKDKRAGDADSDRIASNSSTTSTQALAFSVCRLLAQAQSDGLSSGDRLSSAAGDADGVLSRAVDGSLSATAAAAGASVGSHLHDES